MGNPAGACLCPPSPRPSRPCCPAANAPSRSPGGSCPARGSKTGGPGAPGRPRADPGRCHPARNRARAGRETSSRSARAASRERDARPEQVAHRAGNTPRTARGSAREAVMPTRRQKPVFVFAADTTGRAGDSVCQSASGTSFSSTLAASSPALPLGRAGTFAAVACAREAVLLTSGPPPSQSPPPRARAPRPEPRRTRVRRARTAQRETRPRPAIPRPRATTERCPPRCPRR